MENTNDFQINYWGDMGYVATRSQKRRSIKQRLTIVFCFIGTLALVPVLFYGLTNIKFSENIKVSQASDPIFENKKTVNQNTLIKSENNTIQTETVINNDSYWKITKRVCGNGRNYLSVRDQNNGKALYLGDNVSVNCSL